MAPRPLLLVGAALAMVALLGWLRGWLLMGVVQVGLVQEGSVELVLRESAVLARWETVVVAPASGTLRWMVESGDRVRVGTVVAELENPRAMAGARGDLAALEGQLSMMDLAQAPRRQALGDRRAALRPQIAATVREFRAAILAADTGAMGRGEARLRELLRDYRAAEDENLALTRELALLEQRVIAQRDFLEGLAVELAAPKAGVVNLELDGLEQAVTPRQLVEMSAARLANLAVRPSQARDGQEVRVATPLFKVMDTGETYLALVVPAGQGEAFPENVEVRFIDLGSLPVPASLQYRGTPEPDESMLIVLRVGPAPDALAGMRQAAVEVVLDRWRGPAVDRRALVEREGVMGLMIVADGTARFRGVEVLGGDERQVVVRGVEMGQEIVLNPWLVREGMRIR
ncbi:MAG TPA: hypothetical protein DEQ28_03960 [Clostridiales bacterium]|nr:hypothetical protein [Clostridiales bacterium]